MQGRNELLAVIELGGYPNFTALYRRAGFIVTMVNSVRRALSALKKSRPRVVVAELNFQSDFRDRSSTLETLLATLQKMPKTDLIVFYEREYEAQFERFRSQHSIYGAIAYPVSEQALLELLQQLEPAENER